MAMVRTINRIGYTSIGRVVITAFLCAVAVGLELSLHLQGVFCQAQSIENPLLKVQAGPSDEQSGQDHQVQALPVAMVFMNRCWMKAERSDLAQS